VACLADRKRHHSLLQFRRTIMPDNKLRQRINDFLPQLRVGVDFGEGAGGIAVVRGNNILHAESYVDFHETTLEQRRQLRRGRRTRKAKKMRLARLRSWILRQRLPDGAHLPDLYGVMRDPRFDVQAGVFKTLGLNPAEAQSWIDLARQGKTEADGFVKAVTLIFQKRGYKWDAIELAQMSDAKLKDFLSTARVPTQELCDEIRAQITRRADDPNDPVRGKTRVGVEELLRLLEHARHRPPQPRQAEHRSVKEADLREVIEGFGRAAALPAEVTERWKRELCGSMDSKAQTKPGLLNKVLRSARFENRLKSGCAWCGKPTPRKSKVRHVAYAAAVCNLRVRDGRIPRRLSDGEMQVFWDWWERREAAGTQPCEGRKDAPKAEGIKSQLKRIGAQEKMARQFYDLLWNPDAKGRASLCRQHLEMAAKGMTMKDAGVEWQTVALRKAPNPCREQHDARVLHRLEQILFRPGKTGIEAWRHGPVQLVTLEAPKPETERAGKGEQKERKTESFMGRLAKETGGVCIYCEPADPKPAEDKDHIFPDSRGGPSVWDNLVPACKAHNDEKSNGTPWEWLGRTPRWSAFEARVEGLAGKGVPVREEGSEKSKEPRFIRISQRKRDLLLSRDHDYPDSPTALAHVGSRPRQFVVALGEMFTRRGLSPPRVDYQLGAPHVQRIDGRTTSQLRKSWLKKADELTDNFPPKDRWDLLNHAQDAALIAACPPHTWRETIFCRRASRPNFVGQWVEQDGLATHELSPNWAEYMQRRTWPVVRVLGRYPVGWKRLFADQNFYQEPERLDDKRLIQYVPLEKLKYGGKGPEDERHPSETRIVAPRLDDEFRVAAKEALVEVKATKRTSGEKGESTKETRLRPLNKGETLPAEVLAKKFPGVRHVKVSKNKGGTLARVSPLDGPARKIQLKKASEAVVIWVEKGQPLNKLRLSVRWPAIFRKFGVDRFVPSIPEGATIRATWKRHKLIWLDDATGNQPGYYRVKEFDDAQVTVLPENAVTDELAQRLHLKAEGKRARRITEPGASGPGEETEPGERDAAKGASLRAKEIKLGKNALTAYFESLNSRQ